MAVNPVSGKIYVSNTDALNTALRRTRVVRRRRQCAGTITRTASPSSDGTAVTPRHLNKHIDYSSCCAPIPNDGERAEPRAAHGNGGQRGRPHALCRGHGLGQGGRVRHGAARERHVLPELRRPDRRDGRRPDRARAERIDQPACTCLRGSTTRSRWSIRNRSAEIAAHLDVQSRAGTW